jgi:ABC-2 type transport system permease protein
MIAGALFYYQFHSWRNRLLARIRRLRQPKYLAGAIVGGFYFYFYLFRGFTPGRHHPAMATPLAFPAEMNELPETLAALVFVFMLSMAWILPHSRAALAFSEAEIAFLFPAPISRKTLIQFKLLKSQTAILFSALLMTFIGRGWSGGHFITRALGWWAAFSILNLHLLGSSFALTMLMDRGISTWKRRVLILGAALAAAAGLFIWTRHSLPPFPAVPEQGGMAWLFHYIGRVFESGPLPYLLLPFRLVVAPYFAASYKQFLIALAPVLGIIWLHYLWVIHSNVSFEEASVALSRKLAERIAAARTGHFQGARRPKKAARPPFVLRPAGHPAVAVLWKNLISAGQYVTARVWLMLVWVAVVSGVLLQSPWARGGGGFGTVVIFFVGMLLAMSLFSGPQMLRNDLRQDLPVADVLKMFPMPGWQIVLGEVLAPAAMLAGAQWLLILFGTLFFPEQFDKQVVPLAWRLSVALSAAVVLPFVDVLALLIPNASVLFFPAWFHLGKDAPRGFETMGQQLILMFGQVLVLLLGLTPAAGALALLLLGGSFVHWPLFGLVLGAFAAAMILAIEAGIGIKLLGGVFERFDVSGELLA